MRFPDEFGPKNQFFASVVPDEFDRPRLAPPAREACTVATGAVVPIPIFPLAVKVVNAALFGVVAPIAPGAAQFVVGVALAQVVPLDINT